MQSSPSTPPGVFGTVFVVMVAVVDIIVAVDAAFAVAVVLVVAMVLAVVVVMVLVHGIHVTAEAQKPVTHALNSLIVFTIATPGFCLALGLYLAGIGFYLVAGMAIFALATFAEVKKKINLGSREGVSCCSNFFFLLFLTSGVLVIGFMLETVSSWWPGEWARSAWSTPWDSCSASGQ